MANVVARLAPQSSVASHHHRTQVASTKPRTSATVTWIKPRAMENAAPRVLMRSEMEARGRVVRLFGLKIFDTTIPHAADWIVEKASQRISTQVAFLNAHCVNVMSADGAYLNALENADRIFADGSGIAIAARSADIQLTQNVNGTDLFPVLCASAAKAGVSMFLLGGQAGVAEETAARMSVCNPTLSFAGTHHGYFESKEQEDRLIEKINASGAHILMVGFGVPAQELWIARNRHRLVPAVIVGVGGLFDYYSGRIPRAPSLIRVVGCEWAWRLAMEPRRLAKRYLLGNVEFLTRLLWMRLADREAFNRQFTA